MSDTVRFVYCDIGGVLFDEAGTKYLLKQLNLSSQDFRRYRGDLLASSLLGNISADEFVTTIVQRAGLDIAIDDFNDYWAQNSHSLPLGHQMLEKIAGAYPVGLLTNNMKGSLDSYRRYKLIPDLPYKHIVESSQIGMKKPSLEIYEYAQSLVTVPGKNILFIDDRQINLDAAEKLDWQTLLFDRNHQEQSVKTIEKYLKI